MQRTKPRVPGNTMTTEFHPQAEKNLMTILSDRLAKMPSLNPSEKPCRLSPAVFWVWQGGLSTQPRGKKVNGWIPGASDWLSAQSCGCLGDASPKDRRGGGWPDNPWSSGSLLSWLVLVFLGCCDELSHRALVLSCQNSQFWFGRLCHTRNSSQKSTRCEAL